MVRKRIKGITYYPHNEHGANVTGYANEHDAAHAFNGLLLRFVSEGKMSSSNAEKKMKMVVDEASFPATLRRPETEKKKTVLSSKRKRNDGPSRRCKRACTPAVPATEVVFEASHFDWKEQDEIFRSVHPEHSSTWPFGWHSPDNITFLSSFWDLLAAPSSIELTDWQNIETTKESIWPIPLSSDGNSVRSALAGLELPYRPPLSDCRLDLAYSPPLSDCRLDLAYSPPLSDCPTPDSLSCRPTESEAPQTYPFIPSSIGRRKDWIAWHKEAARDARRGREMERRERNGRHSMYLD